MEATTLREWATYFKRGDYVNPSRDTQIEAGWYDWFCKDQSLQGKTYRLAPKVLKVMKSKKVNVDTMYVFFKNNCPMNGSLYDDFRLCDRESGNVIYTVVPSCGHASVMGRAELWGKENEFKEPLVTGTWKDICKFFGV